MECRECESVLVGYLLDELGDVQMAACREHLEMCSTCRASFGAYTHTLSSLTEEPLVQATVEESASLARALTGIELAPPPVRQPSPRAVRELIGLTAVSVLAFLLIGILAGLQVFGHIDLRSVAQAIGLPRLALAAAVVVFVTSFIPIVVTSRRGTPGEFTFGR